MNINHQPITKVSEVERIYSEKDGVPIKYVCTTDLSGGTMPSDIFYRATPHPRFGNRYFRITFVGEESYIGCADNIESKEFGLIEGPNGWEYSAHRHDYKDVGNGVIDGGRAYTRGSGYKMFKVKNGEFIKDEGNT